MSNKLGVLVVGAGGAVASTIIGGVALMKKGLVPKVGMLTETPLGEMLPLASIDDLEFGGWDLHTTDLFKAAQHHGVIPRHLLSEMEAELKAVRPWPAMASEAFLGGDLGDNRVEAKSYRDELATMQAQVEAFQKERGVDRSIIVNLASTERHTQIADVHVTPAAFEAGLDANDPRIGPAMRYLYLAITMGMPHVNFTPSLSNIPALDAMSRERGIPIAGEDGKTGQTLLKTVLAPAFAIRQLQVQGWYSTNILGNNDGRVLDDPASNKTKVTSKLGVLDNILGYRVNDHQVHIHYYRPRGDAKEAWDNIDLLGFLGERMQLKVNFLCKDSILAAPLVIDLVRLIDIAHRAGERGMQRQLSLFFKAPYRVEGEPVVHDLFEQYRMLQQWAEKVATGLLRPRRLPSAATAPIAWSRLRPDRCGPPPERHEARNVGSRDRRGASHPRQRPTRPLARPRCRGSGRGARRARPGHPLGPAGARGARARAGLRGLRRGAPLPRHQQRHLVAAHGAWRRRASAPATRS